MYIHVYVRLQIYAYILLYIIINSNFCESLKTYTWLLWTYHDAHVHMVQSTKALTWRPT
jgi:hypothetical protein